MADQPKLPSLDHADVDSFLSEPTSAPSAPLEMPDAAPSAPGMDSEGLDSADVNSFLAPELKEAKYGTTGQLLKTGIEGIATGIAGPLATAAEVSSGIATPEDILARREVNPISHYGAEGLGLVLPAIVTAGMSTEARAGLEGLNSLSQLGMIESAGKAAGKLASKVLPESTTLASKIGTVAAKSAVENALLAGSDEVSKMILQDPSQSAESAITSIGLGAALGGVGGAAIGSISPLWEQVAGSKVSKLIEDMKGRIGEHVSGVDAETGIHQELSKYYDDINHLVEGTKGPLGIKSQDIEKLVPPMSEAMDNQVQDISSMMQKQLEKMSEKPNVYPSRFVDKLQTHLDNYIDNISAEGLTSADLFKETEDLKRVFQQYGKYDKVINELSPEHQFVQDAKKIAGDLKSKLEDNEVWGKAGDRQKDFNKAITSYIPKLKDFESKFTSKLADEGRVIDPSKVASFVHSIGKPNAEIRTSVLEKFLEATEDMKKEVGKIHGSLGVTDSIPDSPLNMTKAALKDPTLGAQIADTLFGKLIGEGTGLGAAVGGIFGHKEGFGTLGAILGAHVLGPMFKSILPAITGAVVRVGKASAPGFKAAVDYASQVSKGDEILTKGVKSIFAQGSKAAIGNEVTQAQRDRLEKKLTSVQQNPQGFLSQQSHLDHYLPDHGMAVAQSVSSAATYLNGLRPSVDRAAPLDSPPVTSSFQKAKYNNALNIAQNPSIIFDKIKQGTLTGEDLQHLGALYPNLYKGIQQKLTSEIANQLSKGNMIPYKARMGLSVLMAQPMDSTMSPMSIMAAQQANSFPSVAPSQQQSAPKGSKSSPALQKLPNTFMTGSQSRELRRNKI